MTLPLPTEILCFMVQCFRTVVLKRLPTRNVGENKNNFSIGMIIQGSSQSRFFLHVRMVIADVTFITVSAITPQELPRSPFFF